jgi:hypothetical protein
MLARRSLIHAVLLTLAMSAACNQSPTAHTEPAPEPRSSESVAHPVAPPQPKRAECVPVAKLPKAPRKVRDSQPPWSDLNVRTGGGTLVYDITIGESGDVTNVRRVKRGRSAGPSKAIADAYLRAIREWKFEPTVVDGERVPVCMMVTITIDI